MKNKIRYPFYKVLPYWLFFIGSLIGNLSDAQVCSSYTVYALDDAGYIYPVNTTTAALQTPLNTSGVATGSSASNAIGYSATAGKFYYISNTAAATSTFTSYNGVSTYNTGLASAFTSATYPVLGSATSNGLGFYAIDVNGYLWYYSISANTWTEVATKIVSGSDNITNEIGTEQNGDLAEDGYGTLWLLMSSNSKYGLYYILSPPVTSLGSASLTANQVISYTTSLPTAAGGNAFNGVAFDNTGNLFLSTSADLFEIPIGSKTPTLVAAFSGFKTNGNTITDLSQCTYTSNPLPLAWSYFNTALDNDKVNIGWGIGAPTDINGFYVERSTDSRNWERIGFVPYNYQDVNYSFVDASPLAGVNYYRIDESDDNGSSTLSEVEIISIVSTSNFAIWPNPVLSTAHVQYNGNSSNASMQIIDQFGRVIISATLSPGNNNIDLSGLPSGAYFVLFRQNGAEITYKKIIKRN